jgi:hypothetical protein
MEENEKEESTAKKGIARDLGREAAKGMAYEAGSAVAGRLVNAGLDSLKKAAANRAAQKATMMTATELVRTQAPQAIMTAIRYVILKR